MNFSYWKNYFISNASHFEDVDWNQKDILSPDEKRIITTSLQQFQKGEQSEGKHFYSFAKTFPDPRYAETIRLFIREEQTHAYVLGKFMDMNGIARIKKHWVDNIFRWLRKLTDLENTVTVLITAEIIAKIYYKALRNATGSRILQQLCDQILKDEEQHISFQSNTLNLFYTKKSRIRKFFNRFCHQVLMVGTICIVWVDHQRVLKTGGYSFSSFFMETMLVFLEAEKLIQKQIKMEFAFSGN
ncbi:MAG: hypothetical protein JST75_14545 [Bacteroidetes bacterium]|nr:hypothetical protein [Bacteroidota bacterium]